MLNFKYWKAMAEKTCKLKVVGLPPDLTADQLTIIFKNKRGKGGGPVENVELKNYGQNVFAIITFLAPDAVELIMSRGNTVAIRDVEANVEPLYDQIKTVQKSSPLGDIEDVKTVRDKPMKKPKPIKTKIAQSEKLYKPSINTKPVAPEFYLATSNDKKDTEIFPWDVTVKAYLAKLSQTREFYKYYLEDEEINKEPFYEESLMLDGVNKVFYVTFHDRKGSMAFCNKKHNLNYSNITKVQITTQEDFNTFDNLLFIYGYNIQIEDDLDYLKELVNQHSHLDVSDIIHYEEAPGSAIIVFEPETDITAATWLCTTPSLSHCNLITGLVFKEYGILVTGLNDSIFLSYLKRYMQNKGNGGGKVKSVNYESSYSAVVTFEKESDHHNILQKEDHVINGTHLTLSPFYTCLSKEYQKKFHLGETTPIKSSPQFTVGKAPAVWKTNNQSVALRNKQIHLYTSDRVKNEQKRYFGFLTLINFGFEFLRKHQQQLEEVVRDQSCEMELLPNLLKLKLSWSQRVVGKEVRETLTAGLTAVKQHLDTFTVIQFEIPEPEIVNFQSFCQKQGDMGIFFDHGWKKAVVIGLETPQNIMNMMNAMFSAYLSQQEAEGTSDKNKESKEDFRQRLRPLVKPKPGFLQGKTFQAPVDDSENFQAPSQAPSQAPPQTSTLEDVSTQETFNIEKFLDLETYELMLLDKSKFLVEIEEKYKPIKVVLDFENKKVVFKANESDKVGSAQFDVLKKSKDDFQGLKLDDLLPEQMELLKHDDVLSRINSNLNNGHLQVTSYGRVTLFYIKPEEPGRLKEKIMDEVYVTPKPVDPDMVTILKSTMGSAFLTDLSAPIDGIKMRSVIKLDRHGKYLMIIAPKHQQLLLSQSVDYFLEQNKLHTINVPFSSGKLAFVNRYLKQEVARIASYLGSDVEMKPESYAIKGLQDVAKKCSAVMQRLSDTIVVQDVNLKFFGIQEFLEDAQGKTLIRTIEDRNMCVIISKSDLDKLSKQQASGEEAVIMYNKTKLKIKRGDITREKCEGLVNSIKENMDLSSSGQVCKALLRICGQELQDECTNKISEMAQKGVVSTSGSKLKCKNILHISQDKFTRHWDKGVLKVLEEADKLGIKTLALPALGAGSRPADVLVIKKQILGAIEQFSATGRHSLSYIKLVIFDRNVLDAFLGYRQLDAPSVNEPEGENVIHKEYSQNMDLKIYCNDAIKMNSAIDQLKKECKSAFKEEKEKESKVKMLDKAQLKELERVGLKHGIQVQVRVEEGLMLMHGFNASGMLAVQRCLHKFVFEAVDFHKAMVLGIVWEYKKGDQWHKFEPLLNSELEKEFKDKSSQHELTDAKGRKYIIDFKEMKETLVNDRGSKRCVYEIQRRDKTKEGEPVPRKWDPMSESENLKIVFVKPGSKEYKTVEQHFINGRAQVAIKKIERIQNKTLYKQYSVRKRDLDIRNPKGHKNELKLFHGTSAAPVPQINENGFNRSHCGVNGTVYGNGVYFHMRSSYSVSYAKPDSQGNRYMYQAKVLVGESTPCHSGMSYLPNKPGTNRTFDSGNSGEIYVIFHDANAYPEYLITF